MIPSIIQFGIIDIFKKNDVSKYKANSLSINHLQPSYAYKHTACKYNIGAWILDNEQHRKQRDVMAARGYWQAAQAVKESIRKILDGDNAGKIADFEHGDWYRELFAPSVNSGLLKPSDLAGYRLHQVFIAQSMHVPMNKDAVRETILVLFELLMTEPDAACRAGNAATGIAGLPERLRRILSGQCEAG